MIYFQFIKFLNSNAILELFPVHANKCRINAFKSNDVLQRTPPSSLTKASRNGLGRPQPHLTSPSATSTWWSCQVDCWTQMAETSNSYSDISIVVSVANRTYTVEDPSQSSYWTHLWRKTKSSSDLYILVVIVVPNVIHRFCQFHYGQAISKKLGGCRQMLTICTCV